MIPNLLKINMTLLSSKFLMIWCIFRFAPLSCNAWHFNTSFYILWCSDDLFTKQSSYETNLKYLLSSLSDHAAKATNHGGFYATNTSSITTKNYTNSEIIYGTYTCRGDLKPEDCARCVTNAISYLPPLECPSDKGAIMWYQTCKIRYSNKSFLGKMDKDEDMMNYTWRTEESVSTLTKDVTGYMKKVEDTLHGLVTQLGSPDTLNNRKYFGTNTTILSSAITLYTLSSCTVGLVPSDCKKCLTILSNELSTSCYGSKAGTSLNPNCYMRFAIYPFYNSSTSKGARLASTPIVEGYHKKSHALPKKQKKNKLLLTFLISSILSSTTISILLFIVIRRRIKISSETNDELESIDMVHSLQYDFNTIKTATCNFSADNKIGEGGFGQVYKGKVTSGQEVAVKRLSKNTGQGSEQFKTEVVLVAKLQHKNLVKLLGFCVSSKEKMLVYEFLQNSSLDRFLFGPRRQAILDWQTRFKIIVGIAKGLLYLHEDSRLRVVHRDLKTSNILLDEDMNPKISDFGLAKLFEADQTQGDTKKIAGTYGYIAPEYAITGSYSTKSDIYSFGVIILEILSSQRNLYTTEEPLLSYAWKLWNEGKALDLMDDALNNDFAEEEALKCIHIGLLCIQDNANERPNMTLIVAALNGQAVKFSEPKPPCYLDSLSIRVNNQAKKYSYDPQESYSKYTGVNTITELFPRE